MNLFLSTYDVQGRSKMTRHISAADKAAAANLRRLWQAHKRAHRARQSDAAEALGLSESAVTQYLRGDIALGVRATLRWAKYLGVAPTDIRADYDELANIARPAANSALLREAYKLVDQQLAIAGHPELTPDQRADFMVAVLEQALEEGEVNEKMVRYMHRMLLMSR